MDITRNDFLRKLTRIIMMSLLAGIAMILGSRVVTSGDCSSCPGKGICKGEVDCSKYLQGKK
jgi:hypothetical protein